MKVVLNKKGVRQLLQSPEVQAACMEQASKVIQSCGDGYVSEKRNYPERHGAAVRVASARAHYDNIKNHTLRRAARLE